MNKLLKQIFHENNFQELHLPILNNTEDFFMVNLNEKSINFYLVLLRNEIEEDFLESEVPNYYYAIKGLESGYDDRMDKNLSMLICINREKPFSNEERARSIYNVEEDPYFFRKCVITYSNEQVDLLYQLIHENINDSNTVLNQLINDKESFINFKNEPEKKSMYNLCSKLFIKLPFLVLKRIEETMSDISKEINDELYEKNLLKISKELLELKSEDETTNPDKILDAISGGNKE